MQAAPDEEDPLKRRIRQILGFIDFRGSPSDVDCKVVPMSLTL